MKLNSHPILDISVHGFKKPNETKTLKYIYTIHTHSPYLSLLT